MTRKLYTWKVELLPAKISKIRHNLELHEIFHPRNFPPVRYCIRTCMSISRGYKCILYPPIHPPQDRSLDSLPALPPPITAHFVRLCECLLGSPPDQDCLRYISDNLLVSDLNDVKFVTPPGAFDTSITIFDGVFVLAPKTTKHSHKLRVLHVINSFFSLL